MGMIMAFEFLFGKSDFCCRLGRGQDDLHPLSDLMHWATGCIMRGLGKFFIRQLNEPVRKRCLTAIGIGQPVTQFSDKGCRHIGRSKTQIKYGCDQ